MRLKSEKNISIFIFISLNILPRSLFFFFFRVVGKKREINSNLNSMYVDVYRKTKFLFFFRFLSILEVFFFYIYKVRFEKIEKIEKYFPWIGEWKKKIPTL